MNDQHADRIESEEIARLDQLLELLKQAEVPGPSPAVRNRLGQLYAERLQETPIPTKKPGGRLLKPSLWFRTAAASGALIAVVVMAMFLFRLHQRGHLQADHNAMVASPGVTLASGGRVVAAAPTPKIARLPVRHLRSTKQKDAVPQKMMIVRLPYSNSSIATGTNTTIRVSISQSELVSLGFPMTEPIQDRQVVAELTLGDDGLPRAISLPLPPQVAKEKR
jgi:hypothetical protein